MTDDLKAAEDAARAELARRLYYDPDFRPVHTALLDAYRDAIIARRDAEVAALVEAADTFCRANYNPDSLTPQGYLDALHAALAPFMKGDASD